MKYVFFSKYTFILYHFITTNNNNLTVEQNDMKSMYDWIYFYLVEFYHKDIWYLCKSYKDNCIMIFLHWFSKNIYLEFIKFFLINCMKWWAKGENMGKLCPLLGKKWN